MNLCLAPPPGFIIPAKLDRLNTLLSCLTGLQQAVQRDAFYRLHQAAHESGGGGGVRVTHKVQAAWILDPHPPALCTVLDPGSISSCSNALVWILDPGSIPACISLHPHRTHSTNTHTH